MAIKIIKPAPDTYSATCGRCRCSFTYELSDVRHQYQPWSREVVSCPSCSKSITHPPR